MKGVSDQDFEDVNLRDYHNAYLATNVSLSADVFETFHNTCSKY